MIIQLWAPKATTVDIALGSLRLPMTPSDDGWWTVEVASAGPGTEYTFSLDGGHPLPDPRSP